MRGQVRTNGRGDFENVRVPRDQILREFPAQSLAAADAPPTAPTDDDILEVIKAASEANGGFIAQNAGAALVRQLFPEIARDRARQLVKQVTRSDKPGPKGPKASKEGIRRSGLRRDGSISRSLLELGSNSWLGGNARS